MRTYTKTSIIITTLTVTPLIAAVALIVSTLPGVAREQGFLVADALPFHAGGLAADLASLQVTDTQRQAIKAVFDSECETVVPVVRDLIAERRALRDTIRSEAPSREALSAHCQKITLLETDLAVERARILGRLKPILTQTQLDKLGGMEDRIMARVDSFLNRLSAKPEML